MTEEVKEERIGIDMYMRHVHAIWSSIKVVLDNEIPDTQADVGFLMELMSTIDGQFKETTKQYKLKLTNKELVGAWHCLKIVLDNKLFNTELQMFAIADVMDFIAVEIDVSIAVGNAGQVMDKSPTKLKLVKG